MNLLHRITAKRTHIAARQDSVIEPALVRKPLCEHRLASAWWAVQHKVTEIRLVLASAGSRNGYRLQTRLKLGLEDNSIKNSVDWIRELNEQSKQVEVERLTIPLGLAVRR